MVQTPVILRYTVKSPTHLYALLGIFLVSSLRLQSLCTDRSKHGNVALMFGSFLPQKVAQCSEYRLFCTWLFFTDWIWRAFLRHHRGASCHFTTR